jgi:RHS repeat-associated protein
MNQRTPHTEPTQNSPAAAYGYKYRYNGFGGSAQASHGLSWSHTVPEPASSAWITDGTGNACTERSRSVNQHLQYLPFGESFIDQRTNHDIRFKFTGKERDAESGFDNFGARYYSSDLSVWLSVDPLSDKFPNQSAYSYVGNRPIIVIDPDGRDEFEINKKNGKITKLNSNQYYQDGDNIITVKEGEKYSGDKDLSKLKKVDKLNNSKGDSKYFTAKTISATKNKEFQIFAFQNQDEAESFYFFAAESSDVEWGFGKVKPKLPDGATGYVGSDFNEGSTIILDIIEDYHGKNVTFLSHSHPNSGGPPSYDLRKDGHRVGDLNTAAQSPLNITREVYDPNNGLIYGYSKRTLMNARVNNIPYDYKKKKR